MFSLQAHISPFLLDNYHHWLPPPPSLLTTHTHTHTHTHTLWHYTRMFELALGEGVKFFLGGRCSLKTANSYCSIHL